MIIPIIAGTFPQSNEFIFAAADSIYFEEHGKALINSVLQNTNYSIHVHLYNPTVEQIEWCARPKVTATYEYINTDSFSYIAMTLLNKSAFENHRVKQMVDKGKLYGINHMIQIVEKSYYACARFIRLPEIINHRSTCLAIDVDGIVREQFSMELPDDHDLYLYRKASGEHLAGAMLFNYNSMDFFHEYAAVLRENIVNDNLYWFLDQVVLDELLKKYEYGLLPLGYIDWEMNDDSHIWSAKGKRKHSIKFMYEQSLYTPAHESTISQSLNLH